MAKTPSKLASAMAGAKKILGASVAKPQMVQMPKALSEIHVDEDTIIPAGTLITPEVADAADLDEDTLGNLVEGGHVVLVEVYAGALTEQAEQADA